MLFGFIAYLPICAEQEKSSGTVKVTADFLFKSTTSIDGAKTIKFL